MSKPYTEGIFSSTVINQLESLLQSIQARARRDFSGVGVIVCDNPSVLPVIPIRLKPALPDGDSIIEQLIEISSYESEFHDGFHVISSDFQLKLMAQYFSPPVLDHLSINRNKRFGGRYLAALFGSAIPGVQATGIASKGFGIAIFHNGAEIFFKSAT